MTGLLIKIWLVDSLWALGIPLMTVGIVGIFICLILFLLSIDDDGECLREFRGVLRKYLVYSIILTFVSTLTPSRETTQLIKIGLCAEYAINLAESSESFGKISDNLSSSLVEVSDLIRIQCLNWKNELADKKNERKEEANK